MSHVNQYQTIPMNCPTCGCELLEHQTGKGVTFMVCSKWPACRVSGTPELLERFAKVSEAATSIQGALIAQKNKHDADMERLLAENDRRRKILDELFRCCECQGWFPVSELNPSSPDPQSDPVCSRCLNRAELHNQVVALQQRETPVEKIPDDPVSLDSFVQKVAKLRIYQSRLRKATTAEEREQIRNKAREVLR